MTCFLLYVMLPGAKTNGYFDEMDSPPESAGSKPARQGHAECRLRSRGAPSQSFENYMDTNRSIRCIDSGYFVDNDCGFESRPLSAGKGHGHWRGRNRSQLELWCQQNSPCSLVEQGLGLRCEGDGYFWLPHTQPGSSKAERRVCNPEMAVRVRSRFPLPPLNSEII